MTTLPRLITSQGGKAKAKQGEMADKKADKMIRTERNGGGCAMCNFIAFFSFLFSLGSHDHGGFCALTLTLPAISF
jgi:hypothetical protein